MDYPAAALPPPGRAHVERCPDCRTRADPDCPDCEGTGLIIYRACPRCGDIGRAYRDGRNEKGAMVCQLGCGYAWTVDYPGWAIQQRPAGAWYGAAAEPV